MNLQEHTTRVLKKQAELEKETKKFIKSLESFNKSNEYSKGYISCQKEYEEKLRWIPVEEKLPEIGDCVLLKNEFYEYVGFLSKNKKDFRALTVEISDSNEKISGVTHWRYFL